MLTVVIPCFNEEAAIAAFDAELFGPLEALREDFEVLFIDDGSQDGTLAALSSIAAARKGARVLTHGRNRGLGASLRTGLGAARGELVAVLDADLTFHPRHIARLLAAQRETGADCVSGSPFLGGMEDIPLIRRWPSLTLNALYRKFLNPRLTSYTPMFRLYRREAIRALTLASDGFEISVEILAGLLRSGARVVEIPVPLTRRTAGESKLRRLRELSNHARLAWRLL